MIGDWKIIDVEHHVDGHPVRIVVQKGEVTHTLRVDPPVSTKCHIQEKHPWYTWAIKRIECGPFPEAIVGEWSELQAEMGYDLTHLWADRCALDLGDCQ